MINHWYKSTDDDRPEYSPLEGCFVCSGGGGRINRGNGLD